MFHSLEIGVIRLTAVATDEPIVSYLHISQLCMAVPRVADYSTYRIELIIALYKPCSLSGIGLELCIFFSKGGTAKTEA